MATPEQGPDLGRMSPQRRLRPCSLSREKPAPQQPSGPSHVGCGLSYHTRGFPLNPTCFSISLLPALPPSHQLSRLIFFFFQMKLKLSKLTPKIIWYFYWDHIECIDVLRELGICTIYSLKFFLDCLTSPPPASSPSSLPSLWGTGWGAG